MKRHASTTGLVLAAAIAFGCSKGRDLPAPKGPRLDEEPPPPVKDMSRTSGLIIQSSPPTKILVNGKSVGSSPVTVDDLAAGSHEITFVDEAHGDVTMTVELAVGEYQRVHHNLVPRAKDFKPDAREKPKDK
jgi:hypothetical protein